MTTDAIPASAKEIPPETKMLNIAAAHHRLMRQALTDCLSALEAVRDRDRTLQRDYSFWLELGPGHIAIYQARKALKPIWEPHKP